MHILDLMMLIYEYGQVPLFKKIKIKSLSDSELKAFEE